MRAASSTVQSGFPALITGGTIGNECLDRDSIRARGFLFYGTIEFVPTSSGGRLDDTGTLDDSDSVAYATWSQLAEFTMSPKQPKPTEQNSESQHPVLQAAEHIVGIGLRAAAGGAVGTVLGVGGGPPGMVAGAMSGALAGGHEERAWGERAE